MEKEKHTLDLKMQWQKWETKKMNTAYNLIFGDSQHSKIIELFLEQRESSFSFNEIAEYAHVKRDVIRPLINLYLVMRILIEKKVGNKNEFKLNQRSGYSKNLILIYDRLSNENINTFSKLIKKIQLARKIQ